MGRVPVEKSGGFLARRIAWRGPRPSPRRAARRAATGFWRVGGGPEGDQELRKGLANAGGGERTADGALRALPGQGHVVNRPAGEAELRIGQQHQPGPAVRLLRVAHAGRGPVEPLLAEAVGCRSSSARICAAATVWALALGATRRTSSGAVQLSWVKLTCASQA